MLIVVLVGCGGKIEEFRIEDYREFIENDEYVYDKFVIEGTIEDESQAKKIAENIWLELYGDSIKKQKPYVVLRDNKKSAWLVHGTMKK